MEKYAQFIIVKVELWLVNRLYFVMDQRNIKLVIKKNFKILGCVYNRN